VPQAARQYCGAITNNGRLCAATPILAGSIMFGLTGLVLFGLAILTGYVSPSRRLSSALTWLLKLRGH